MTVDVNLVNEVFLATLAVGDTFMLNSRHDRHYIKSDNGVGATQLCVCLNDGIASRLSLSLAVVKTDLKVVSNG